MGFVKYTAPTEHYYPIRDPIVNPIKNAHSFRKTASVFNPEYILSQLKPGEVPLHVIALGCDEFYGPNKNGDAFTKQACRDFHHTFVKQGHWFREHNHSDPKKSYGRVVASIFNEPLGRVELIVALNGTKEAAERNNGLVADKEIAALEAGRELGVSMACKVAYDVCSGCGNKATSRKEYCGSTCKYGGAKTNLGKVFEDGHHLRVFNPEPVFFDISYVAKPADRIAWALGKIASENPKIPDWVIQYPNEEEIKIQLNILGNLAETAKHQQLAPSKLAVAFAPETFTVEGLAELAKEDDIPQLIYKLASKKVILPFEAFLEVFAGINKKTAMEVGKKVRPYLTEVYDDLLNSEDILAKLARNVFFPRKTQISVYNTIDKVAQALALSADNIFSRFKQNQMVGKELQLYKTANTSSPSKALAKEYALYQIAALSAWPEKEKPYKFTVLMNLA